VKESPKTRTRRQRFTKRFEKVTAPGKATTKGGKKPAKPEKKTTALKIHRKKEREEIADKLHGGTISIKGSPQGKKAREREEFPTI